MPRITDFWETILLGAQRYSGGAFRPHAELNAKIPLRAGHFERWLYIRRTTVDELCAGEHAELANAHADRVGRAFYQRVEAMNAAPSAHGPLGVTQHPAA